jgi:hypothetical protein
MAHYAIIDENNNVLNVIVGREEGETLEGISDWETHYSEVTGFRVLRTSYNTNGGEHLAGGVAFRGNYAGIGFTYDEALDAFIPPRPFDSWTLNEQTYLWEAPVEHPEDGKNYTWDEEAGAWTAVE